MTTKRTNKRLPTFEAHMRVSSFHFAPCLPNKNLILRNTEEALGLFSDVVKVTRIDKKEIAH